MRFAGNIFEPSDFFRYRRVAARPISLLAARDSVGPRDTFGLTARLFKVLFAISFFCISSSSLASAILSQEFFILKKGTAFTNPDEIVLSEGACDTLRKSFATGSLIKSGGGMDFARSSLEGHKISVIKIRVRAASGESLFLSSPLGIVEHGLLCEVSMPTAPLDTFHMRGKDGALFTYPSLKVTFDSSGERELLVLFHSSIAPLIPVTWMSDESAAAFSRYDILLYIFLAGGLLSSILYNSFLWLGAKKDIYKYNVMYIASMMLFNLSFGHFYGILIAGAPSPEAQRLVAFAVEMVGNASSFASGALVIHFLLAYLGEEKRMRWYYRSSRLVVFVGLVMSLISLSAPFISAGNLFGQVARPFASLAVVVTLIGLLYSALVLRSKFGAFFLLAYTPLLVGVSLYLPFLEGGGDGTIFARNAMLMGSFLESVLLSFAVGYRQKLAEDDATRRSQEYGERLKTLNDELEFKVESKTQSMKSILSSVNQGLVIIESAKDGSLAVGEESSAKTASILGMDVTAGKAMSDVIFAKLDLSKEDKSMIETTLLTSIDAPVINFEMNAHLLPRSVEMKKNSGSKHLRLYWDPVVVKGVVSRFVLTVIDATDELAQLEVVAEHEESMRVVIAAVARGEQMTTAVMSEVMDHVREARKASEEWGEGALAEVKRRIHTVKGLARSLGFATLASKTHEIEDSICRLGSSTCQILKSSGPSLRETASAKEDLMMGRILARKAVSDLDEALTKHLAVIEKFLHWAIERKDRSDRGNVPTEVSLQWLLVTSIAAAETAAKTLGKEMPNVVISGLDFVEASPDLALGLREAFIHILTNAVDHGIETAEERLSSGKNVRGTVKVTASREHDGVKISIFDDGRGLDLKSLREKLRARGVQFTSDTEAANLIFLGDLSTKAQVSEISGRGVGLGAVKKAMAENGGDVRIELLSETSPDGRSPFRTILLLPAAVKEAPAAARNEPVLDKAL